MKESQEGQENVEDDLREMRLKNRSLDKEYTNSLEESYFIACDSFENVLQQVVFFYPTSLSHKNKSVLLDD